MFRATVAAFAVFLAAAQHAAAPEECVPGSDACKAESTEQEAASMKVSMLQKRGGAARVQTEEEIESLEDRRAAILTELEDLDVQLAATGEDEAELIAWSIREIMQAGDQIHLKSQNKYLDTCGGSNCQGGYGVSMAASATRDRQSGTWVIVKAHGGTGPVNYNEPVHIKNLLGRGTYLDACGYSSCSNGGFGIRSGSETNRQGNSGTWKIEGKVQRYGPVKYNDQIRIKSMGNGIGGMLHGTFLGVCNTNSPTGGCGNNVAASRGNSMSTWEITK